MDQSLMASHYLQTYPSKRHSSYITVQGAALFEWLDRSQIQFSETVADSLFIY